MPTADKPMSKTFTPTYTLDRCCIKPSIGARLRLLDSSSSSIALAMRFRGGRLGTSSSRFLPTLQPPKLRPFKNPDQPTTLSAQTAFEGGRIMEPAPFQPSIVSDISPCSVAHLKVSHAAVGLKSRTGKPPLRASLSSTLLTFALPLRATTLRSSASICPTLLPITRSVTAICS